MREAEAPNTAGLKKRDNLVDECSWDYDWMCCRLIKYLLTCQIITSFFVSRRTEFVTGKNKDVILET